MKIAVVFLAALLSLVSAQAICEPFAGNPPVCADLIDYPVWVPPNFTQAFLAASLNQNLGLINLLPGDCARATLRSACSQAFRKCGSIGLPLPLCPSFCTQANQVCGAIAPQNCSADDPVISAVVGQPVPLYAPSALVGPPEACAFANASDTVQLDCPYPFLFNKDRNECNMKCPPTGLDNEGQQHASYVTVWVLAVLSLVGCLLHIPPMAIQYRPNTSGYALWWFVCQVIGNLGILSGRWKPWEEFLCKDRFTIRTADTFYCGVSAVFNYNGYLGSTLWIAFIMYKILAGITRNKFALFGTTGVIRFISEHTALHILGWVPHLVLTVVLLAKGWFNATTGYTCEVDPAQKWVFYGMLIIPLTVYSFITVVLSAAVLYFVVRNGVRAMVAQWRLFVLTGYYTAIVITVLVISYYTQERTDDTIVAIGKYVQCAATLGDSFCKYEPPVPWSVGFVSIVLTVSVGFIMSLIFWNRSTMLAWRYIIGRTTGLYAVSDWQSGSADSVGSHTSGSHGTTMHSSQHSNL